MKFPQTNRPVFVVTILFALVFLVLPYAAILFDSGMTLATRDLFRTYLPTKFFWLNTLQTEGALPTWNPYLFSGTPFWSDPKSGVLNPFNLTLLPFSPDNIHYAVSWHIFLHLPVMAYGMFRFLRKLDIEFGIAVTFAVAYALSGLVSSSTWMPNLLAGLTILPYFAALWYDRYQRPQPRFGKNALGLSVCLALPIYCVTPEFSYFFAIALGVVWLRRRNPAELLDLALIGAGGFLLAAAQLLPALETFFGSKRQVDPKTYRLAGQYAFHPGRIREFFMTFPFGNYVPTMTYWGEVFTNQTIGPLFFSLYVGAGLPTALAAFFYQWRKTKPIMPAAFSLAAVFFLVLSFGVFSPVDVYELFFRFFPGWGLFRYPEKMLIPLTFLLFVAQAIGWQCLLREAETKRGQARWWGLGAFAFGFFALLLSIMRFSTAERREYGMESLWTYLTLGGFLAGLPFLLRRYPNFLRYRWLFLLALVGLDAGIHARAQLWEEPREILNSTTVDKVKKSLADRAAEVEAGAAYRYSSLVVNVFSLHTRTPPGLEVGTVGRNAHSGLYRLLPSITMLNGIHDINGGGVLHNAGRMDLWFALSDKNPRRLFDILGVYYFGDFVLAPNGKATDEVVVKLNVTALPFVFVPAEVVRVPEASVDKTLTQESFPVGQRLLLVADEESAPVPNAKGIKAKILERRTDSLRIRFSGVTGEEPRYVAIGESYERHWHARVDGRPVKVEKANGWSMAVDLGRECSPECVLELRYENPWIRLGVAITLAFLALVFGAWVRKRKRTAKDVSA